MPQDSQYILEVPNAWGDGDGGLGDRNETILSVAYPKSPIYTTGDVYNGLDATVKSLFEELVQVGTVASTMAEGETANVPTAFSSYNRDYTGNTDWAGSANFPAMPLSTAEATAANVPSSYMPNINSPVDADPNNQPAIMTTAQIAELPTAAASNQYGSDSQKGTLTPAVATESINDQVLSTLASLMGSAGSYADSSSTE